MSLEKFKKFIAARLGADPSSLEFYSLGNLLEGEDIPLAKAACVHCAGSPPADVQA